MTEQEARETICPKYKAAILANSNKDYYPSDLNKIDDIKCDASDCMMWRETGKLICKKCDGEKNSDGTGSWMVKCIHNWEKDGYCGLGGQR